MRTLTTAAVIAIGSIAATASGAAFTNANLVYSNNFNDYGGTGFATSPASGQLDSDDIIGRGIFDTGTGLMAFGDDQTTGKFARGTLSGLNTANGGFWAFDVDPSGNTDYALGMALDGNQLTPGEYIIRVTNNTSFALTSVRVQAELYALSRNAGTSNLSVTYSVGANPVANAVANNASNNSLLSNTTLIDSLTSGDAVSSTVTTKAVDSTVTGLNIQPGQHFFLYLHSRETGGRDNFAIDDVVLTAVPEPAGLAALSTALLPLAIRRRRGA